MTEQNNTTTAPVQPEAVQLTPTPEPAPVVQTTESATTVAPTPVVEPAPVAPAVPEVPAAPVAPTPVAPTPVVPAPVVEPAPVAPAVPEVPAAPVAPTPAAPAPVVEPAPVAPAVPDVPATPVAPTPVTPAPVVEPAPVASPAPAPVSTDIVPSEPLNPIGDNATIKPSTITPSVENIKNAEPTAPANGSVGFVASSGPLPKKKNKGLIIGIVVAVIVIIALVGYFFIFPMIIKSQMTPKVIYENSIKAVFSEVNSTVNDVVHEKSIYDIKATLDSNIETLKPFSGYTYGVNIGVDPVKESVQAGFSLKDANNTYSMNAYIKDGNKYSRYSTDNELNYLGVTTAEETDALFAQFREALSSSEKINNEEMTYLINKFSELVVASLKEDNLSQEDTTITIDGEATKVINNKYVVDEATANETKKYIYEELKKDAEAVKILAKALEISEDEVKKMLTIEEETKEDTEQKYDDYTDVENGDEEDIQKYEEEAKFETLIFNIYVSSKDMEPIGFAVTNEDKSTEIHYYYTDSFFEFKLHTSSLDVETNKDIENTILVVGTKVKEVINVSVKYNDKEVATAIIKTLTETEIDLEYEIISDSEDVANVTGTFKYTIDENDKRNNQKYEFTLKSGEQFVNASLDITLDWTSEVAHINTGTAKTLTEAELATKQANFMTELGKTPIGVLMQTLGGDMSGGLNDYYTDSPSYNIEYKPEVDITVDNNNHIEED